MMRKNDIGGEGAIEANLEGAWIKNHFVPGQRGRVEAAEADMPGALRRWAAVGPGVY